ncbi:MAG: hypothetical protein ACLFRE_01085 [Desulfovermiculus sp.]
MRVSPGIVEHVLEKTVNGSIQADQGYSVKEIISPGERMSDILFSTIRDCPASLSPVSSYDPG